MGKPNQSTGRWMPRGGALLAALALALALSAEAGGTSVSGPGRGGGGGTATRPHHSTPDDAEACAGDPANVVRRLERQGLRVDVLASSDDGECALHSEGQVREFFQAHPCSAMFRLLLEAQDTHGNTALVVVARVDLTNVGLAREFDCLVDQAGAGTIRDLSREVERVQDIRFTHEHDASARCGSAVVVTRAHPITPGPGAVALAEFAVNATLASQK